MALQAAGSILIVIVGAAVLIRLSGIMSQVSFINNLWWAKVAAIVGVALWETGGTIEKMGQQKISRRLGIIVITLIVLALITAMVYFFTPVGKWLFWLSAGLFVIGCICGEVGDDDTATAEPEKN